MQRLQQCVYRNIASLFIMLIFINILYGCGENTQSSVSSSPTQLQLASHSDPLLSVREPVNDKLRQFGSMLQQMQQDGIDITADRQTFNTIQNAVSTAQSEKALEQLTNQIDNAIAAIQFPLTQGNAKRLVNQFHKAVDAWGQNHQYQDTYDNKSYAQDYAYNVQEGFGDQLDNMLKAATAMTDYQNTINSVNDLSTLFNTMQADANDKTLWNQPHATDTQIMQHYQTGGMAIVVSLYEQAMRIYQNGNLLKSYQVVTGQFLRPTPPGLFHLYARYTQILFTSYEPVDSPLYYPPMIVRNAVAFRDQGYFIHASPWRTYYGHGNNFPHNDPQNQNVESRNGSHGCVNLPLDQAQWIFDHAPDGTAMIIY